LLRRATSFPSLSRDIFSKHIGDLLRPIREPHYVNDTAGQLAEKNQNRLVVEAQENLGALNADSTRLKQILLNLLAMPASSRKNTGRARKIGSLCGPVNAAVAMCYS
jgi:hypothetical protein